VQRKDQIAAVVSTATGAEFGNCFLRPVVRLASIEVDGPNVPEGMVEQQLLDVSVDATTPKWEPNKSKADTKRRASSNP